MANEVSRRDELLELFMSDSLTVTQRLELHDMLRAEVRDETKPLQDRLLASLVSRLMDAGR